MKLVEESRYGWDCIECFTSHTASESEMSYHKEAAISYSPQR